MLRILFVTPEPEETVRFKTVLQQNGIVSLVTHSDSTAEEICRACSGLYPDLVVADLRKSFDALPLRALRHRLGEAWHGSANNAPLIMVLLGVRQLAGRDWFPLADDFLAPPHTPDELLARVRLLLFRRRQVETGDMIRFRDVTLDLHGGIARHSSTDMVVSLTPREWELLRFLLTHRGKLYSRERLLDFVWGVDYAGGPRTVDIHVRRLRAKLPPEASASLENRRGLGYGFVGISG
ncbi:MAG: response regulator transcription factor [Fibrella sp.]|nr:response regulator transcription factor [Armatimonadota bacterium]